MIGKVLAHYHILEKLGEGGMGTVWKARDTHLDRFVALKLLPPEYVSDAARTRRFTQEAKAASALNHPNIVTVHDVAQADGVHFIAMEFVQGKTLEELIGHKPLKLSAALRYAVQIADALAKAHSAGIIHRDLKPSNIMITDDGRVKVLDFGLAKLTEPAHEDNVSTQTLTAAGQPLTEEGIIVGTASYMSPEQAEGKAVDARSDMFSFGSVLYEMISGHRAFQGGSRVSTLSAILHSEPAPVRDFVEDVPREIETLLMRCFRKDPERRIQDMRDLKIILEELRDQSESGSLTTSRELLFPQPVRRRWLIPGLIGILAVASISWFAMARSKTGSTERIVPITTFPGMEIEPALSPDGKQVAFLWNGEKQNHYDIYVKLIDAGSPLRLTSEPGDYGSPSWSPDGRYITFVRRSDAQQRMSDVISVPALGGPERKLAQTNIGSSFSSKLAWSPDGRWLALPDKASVQEGSTLFILSAETGQKKRLTLPLSDVWADCQPAFSPDGQTLAFRRVFGPWTSDLYLLPLAPDGSPAGEPKRLTSDHRDITGFDWTPDGREIVFGSNRAGAHSLWRISSAGGSPRRLASGGEDAYDVSIAHYGLTGDSRLAYARGTIDTNLWRIPSDGSGSATRLIASTQDDYHPQYSPDGKKIAFASKRSGSEEIWVSDSDGSNPVQLTFYNGPATGAPRWSPDSRWLAFDSRKESGHGDIYVIDAQGGSPRRLTTGAGDEVRPSWSRDGRHIYYAAYRDQVWQIWKMPAAGGPESQVTKNGGREAFESRDAKFLYYVKVDGPGIWRSRTDGEEETQVIANGWSGSWALAENGIYRIKLETPPPAVDFLDFATGRTSSIAKLPIESNQFTFPRGFCVSPDGRWIVFQKTDLVESDIMLVENFR